VGWDVDRVDVQRGDRTVLADLVGEEVGDAAGAGADVQTTLPGQVHQCVDAVGGDRVE